ncbi:unnamed protein product [Sphagnum jensenii]
MSNALFITTLPLLCFSSDGIPASPQEVLALLAMKRAFEDPRHQLRSWNESGVGACSGNWTGIKCAQGQVIGITLSNKGLGGSLAQQVGQLTSLRKLNLHNNLLSGELPGTLVNLRNLRGLYLFRNNFSGFLPAGLGSSSPGLQAMDLSYNQLEGPVPESVSLASRLLRLNLNNNRLNGTLPATSWVAATQLQYLDLSSNALSGSVPEGLSNASSLMFLNLAANRMSGSLPSSLGNIRSLQSLNVSENFFSGTIPDSLGNATGLTTLDFAHNNFSGSIPSSFSQLGNLTSFDVSYNSLTGIVPPLRHNFSSSSFVDNAGLCGYNGLPACQAPANATGAAPSPSSPAARAPAAAPALAPSSAAANATATVHHKRHRLSTVTIICIALGSTLVGVAVVCCLVLLLCRRDVAGSGSNDASGGGAAGKGAAAAAGQQSTEEEGEVGGKLVHFDGPLLFTADDLLCATALVLGKSTYGTVYKATLENGSHIAVKRLREGIVKSQREFEMEVNVLGRIRHPNLLALRAYYWGPKDEKLLVFDFIGGGSLAAFLHARGPDTALDWRTRMRIATGTARGLLQLHVIEHIIHGNLTASNILVDASAYPIISAQVSDYGLARLMTPAAISNVLIATAGSTGYRAPELDKSKKPNTKSDVYSFGIVLLELLTGKAPADVSATEGALDLPDYVAGIVKENWTAEVFDLELLKGPYAPSEEELMTALQLAMRCVTNPPSDRPEMDEVLRNLEELSPPAEVKDDGSTTPSK